MSASAEAASLQVSPISLEAPAPGKTVTLNLRNAGARPLQAQIRVFEWRQEDGREILTPATDVVASPPEAVLSPRTPYTVRLVRIGGESASERAYRVLVDELPDDNAPAGAGVALVMRYSIPLFFSVAPHARSSLDWRIAQVDGRSRLVARNDGPRRVRLSAVSVSAGGRVTRMGPGLFGYVLAGSSMSFPAPGGAAPGAPVKVNATTDQGPLDARRVR